MTMLLLYQPIMRGQQVTAYAEKQWEQLVEDIRDTNAEIVKMDDTFYNAVKGNHIAILNYVNRQRQLLKSIKVEKLLNNMGGMQP